MKQLKIFFFLLSLSYFVKGQNIDSSGYTTGYEVGYHNVALFQAPKNKWYFKNKNFLLSSIGKNFNNRFEVEAGVLNLFRPYEPKFLMGRLFLFQIKTRFIYPINKKVSVGIMTNYSNLSFYDYKLRDGSRPEGSISKLELSSGLTYKEYKAIHSVNVNYGQAFNTSYPEDKNKSLTTNIWLSAYSFTYYFNRELKNNWNFIAENKFNVVSTHFQLPDNFGDSSFFLLEQILFFRKHEDTHIISFGLLSYFGIRGNQIKYTPIPYLSFAKNF